VAKQIRDLPDPVPDGFIRKFAAVGVPAPQSVCATCAGTTDTTG
jgi:hypothetical protein